MTTDLNLLMSRMDEINSKLPGEFTADDIDTIIAYHRHRRSQKASGVKPDKPKIDLAALMGTISKPKPSAPIFKGKL